MELPTVNSNDSKDSLTYGSYLKINDLLKLQHPLASPAAHDEMLFIVIHQVYELWFKLVIFEADSLIKNLEKDRFLQCFHSLERICEVFRVLIQQLDVLETMTPVEFNRFRSKLNPASGFQSLQFRELELLSGAALSDYHKFLDIEPEWKSTLDTRGEKPSLRTAFVGALKRHQKLQGDTFEEVVDAVRTIYEESEKSEFQTLCEFLIRYDELISLWRFRHVQMVERMIGMKHGTGGSLGVPYLQGTLRKRFFPELWQARTKMGGEY